MSGSPSPKVTVVRSLQKHSCVTCSKRKVKCDRKVPCTNCERMQSECEYRDPAPPRRRKKRPPEEDLLDRCKRYEDMLRSYGANIDSPLVGDDESQVRRPSQSGLSGSGRNDQDDESNHESNQATERSEFPKGRIVVSQGKSRYVESHLWNTFSEAFRNPSEILVDSASSDDEEDDEPQQKLIELERINEEDLFFGIAPKIRDMSALHPDPPTIRRLWTLFIENVNSIIKVVHVPSTEALIFEAIDDPRSISKSLEVLLFAIYGCAVCSLDKEQCKRIFGQDRQRYLAKWLGAGRLALTNSRFLRTSDFMVLQGFVLYLIASQSLFDTRSAWTISGIAVRIGQRIGLDKDAAEYGLGPFEVEMRRRLWWQITWMDARSGQLAGIAISPSHPGWDVKRPLNVNDSDLYPGMEADPVERQGATEMMFCLLRFEMTKFFREIKSKWTFKGSTRQPNSSFSTVEEREQIVDQLEASIEEKFLRYCDPLVPLHLISTIIARSALCMIRILAHHPRHNPDRGKTMSESEKDFLFALSLKALEYDSLTQSTATTQQFLWHTRTYFQWPAWMVLLDILRTRISGDDIDKAWCTVEDVFRNHSELALSTGNPLYLACGNLTLKAWEARVAVNPALRASAYPEYIRQLYARREKAARKAASKESGSTPSDIPVPMDSAPLMNQPSWSTPENVADIAQEFSISQSPVDWNEWDNILQSFQMPEFSVQERNYLYS